MPIHVECPGCKRHFQAPDQALGKTIKCPQCSTIIQVEASTPRTCPQEPPLLVECICTKRLTVPREYAGKQVKCPGCGQVVAIPRPQSTPTAPAAGETDLGQLLDMEMNNTATAPLAPLARKKKRSGTGMWWAIGLGTGGVVLIVLLIIIFNSSGDDNRTAETGNESTQRHSSMAQGGLHRGQNFSSDPMTTGDVSLPEAVTRPPDWLADNAPFDVTAYFDAPPPEENAAPLYLNAFYEFYSDMEDCFPKEERARRSPVVKRREARLKRIHEAWKKDPASIDSAEADALLAEYKVGFDKLALAQQCKKCVFEPGIDITALVPHLLGAREVFYALEIRSARNLDRGNVDLALDDIEIGLRLSRDIRNRGQIISLLVSTAIELSVSKSLVPEILSTKSLTTTQCNRLIELLSRQDRSADPFLASVQGEYLMCRLFLHDLEHRTGCFAPDAIGEIEKEKAILDSMFFKGWTDFVLKQSPQQVRSQVARLDQWYRTIAATARDGVFERARVSDQVCRNLQRKRQVITVLLPAFDSVAHALARTEAIRRGTLCLVALRLWQLDNGTPPPDLKIACEAAGLDGIPLDPYGDGPLQMTMLDGKPVVYSVGPDQKDDGARREWNLDLKAPKGDLVFRLPTVE